MSKDLKNRERCLPPMLRWGWPVMGGAVLFAALWTKAYAIDWQLNQSVSADVTYSDNVDLDTDNQKESGIVPGATYTLSGTGQGGRVLFATDTRLRLRGETDKFDADVDQRINALGRVEVAKNRLFLDGLVDSVQVLRDANSSVSANPNSTRNSTDSVTTFAISPVYQEKLGNWADTQLSYEHREVFADGDNDDARLDRIDLFVAAGSRFALWKPTFGTGWVDYREHDIAPGNSKDDVKTLYFEVDNQFQVSRNYALVGLIGYNDVDASSTNRDLSGFYWNAGVRGTPGPRTQFDIRFGQRFDEFGITGSLSYLVTPNLTFRASAAHDVGTAVVRSGRQFQRLSVAQLQGGLAGGNGLPLGFVTGNNLDDGLSTQQSFGLGLVGDYGRSTYTFGSNWSTRTFDNGTAADGDDITWANRFSWSHQLSRSLSVNAGVGYRFVDERNRPSSHTIGGQVGLDYQLGPNSAVFGNISRTDRFSDLSADEYTENAITIGGRLNF